MQAYLATLGAPPEEEQAAPQEAQPMEEQATPLQAEPMGEQPTPQEAQPMEEQPTVQGDEAMEQAYWERWSDAGGCLATRSGWEIYQKACRSMSLCMRSRPTARLWM